MAEKSRFTQWKNDARIRMISAFHWLLLSADEAFKADSGFPRPDSPWLYKIVNAIGFTIIMPVLWPAMMAFFFSMWLFLGALIAFIVCVIPFIPVFALFGIPKSDNEEFEVVISREEAPRIKEVVREAGGRVRSS